LGKRNVADCLTPIVQVLGTDGARVKTCLKYGFEDPVQPSAQRRIGDGATRNLTIQYGYLRENPTKKSSCVYR
jgi:hypothetical protein